MKIDKQSGSIITKHHQISLTLLMVAMAFLMMVMVSQNWAYLGSVVICAIFGIKRRKDNEPINKDRP